MDIVHARILLAESVQVVHVVSRVPLVQQTDASVPHVAQRSASMEFRAGRFHLLHRLSRDAFYFSLGQEFPVYMAAGFIIFAMSLCLVLKLNAVALQQKAISEFLGSSLYVQQLVGVHTLNIRVIEKVSLWRAQLADLCAHWCPPLILVPYVIGDFASSARGGRA